jgi:3-dehydroquinate synthase
VVTHVDEQRLRSVSEKVAARWTVSTHQPIHYEIESVPGVLDVDNLRLVDFTTDGRRLVVVDDAVAGLYRERIEHYFSSNTREFRLLTLPGGEANKNDAALDQLYAGFESFGLKRRSEPVIAIGGGVLMDTVAFASSVYRRATPYVKVPTTLIGLVDAGIGVKTGVNWKSHKNRIGSYDAPSAVFLDLSFLNTLPARHVSNGLAEILKIALIKDRDLFELLESRGPGIVRDDVDWARPDAALTSIVQRAITGMLEELEPNLREHVLERKVDYGHTFSPVIEMASLPALLHGEAVAIDMMLTTAIAHRRGYLSGEERDRVLAVNRSLGLPSTDDVLTEELLTQALEDTVAHRDGLQRTPLPRGIGQCTFVNDITSDEIATALGDIRGAAAALAGSARA